MIDYNKRDWDARSWELECDGCGGAAAFGGLEDEVNDGDILVCGCNGCISVDTEEEPHAIHYDWCLRCEELHAAWEATDGD